MVQVAETAYHSGWFHRRNRVVGMLRCSRRANRKSEHSNSKGESLHGVSPGKCGADTLVRGNYLYPILAEGRRTVSNNNGSLVRIGRASNSKTSKSETRAGSKMKPSACIDECVKPYFFTTRMRARTTAI